ncbi:MAG: hypothetical protein WBA77_18795 [Microcoleaceae cyanobacterium]
MNRQGLGLKQVSSSFDPTTTPEQCIQPVTEIGNITNQEFA